VGVFLAGAWAYLRYTEPTYKCDATVQIDPGANISFLQKRNESSGFLPIESLLEAYLELFSSHDLIERVVDSLKLEWEIYSVGRVGRSLVFPTPFWISSGSPAQDSLLWRGAPVEVHIGPDKICEVWIGEQKAAQGVLGQWMKWGHNGSLRVIPTDSLVPLMGVYQVYRLPRRSVVVSWQNRVGVIPKRGFTVLQVSVTDKSSARATRFLAKLLELSREHERLLRQTQYEKALRYVDTLLGFVQGELSAVQDTLYAIEKKSEAPFISARKQRVLELFSALSQPGEDIYFTQLKQIELVGQAITDTLSKQPGANLPFLPIMDEVGETVRAQLFRINEAIERRGRLLRLYQSESPVILTHNQLILQQVTQLLQTIREVIREKRYIQRQSATYLLQGKEQVYRDIFSERQFSFLQEDLTLRREIYKSLLEKKIQLSIDKETVISAIRVTQPPLTPLVPLYPNPLQIYIIVISLGIFVGVGGVVLKYVIDQRVSYRIDVEQISPVPVIGELPYDRQKSEGIFSLTSLQLEILRTIRGALGFVWEGNGPRVVVVTSTVSGEGKTFVARGLAYVYALAGYRVLLIDADLRRATLSHSVGARERGLSLVLAHLMETSTVWEDILIPMEQEGLFLLPAGPIAPNPPELLENPTLDEIIQELGKRFDYIIIDTAPVGLIPDTLSILRRIPQAVTLYVFRAEYSRIPFLSHMQDIIQKHHLQKVYLLFNGTRLSKPRYGYGYGYGYYGEGYGRSYYYTRSGSSTKLWDKVREWLPV
jgi:capsular exopolysaccharide synthesis family protein